MQIFGGPEIQGQDGAGGVVNGAVQSELGPARLEPREGAGVELDEGAHLGLRAPPGAHQATPALPLGGEAEGAAQAPHGGPAEHEALDLPQFLGGMAVVEAGVGALQQFGDGRAHVGRQPAGRRPAAETVHEAPRALAGEAHLQPLKLPDAEVQGPGPLGIADLPGQRGVEQPGPKHFLAAHRDRLPCLHGVTLLRNSYGVTFL